MWGPFRAQDLSWLNSEEKICLASEHRCTFPCTEKAMLLLPTKQVQRDLYKITDKLYLIPLLVHLRGVSMQPANSHPFSGSCASS